MDSPTDFDDNDELFFGNCAAEPATPGESHEFDDADAQPPTPEQLAHFARFRKPVAGVVASMALLSLVAFATHGLPQLGPEQKLVAHYESALPASTRPARVQQAGVVLDTSSASVPEALSALLADALSTFVPETSSAADAASLPALAVTETAPAPAADAAFTELFTQPDSNPDAAFISLPPPMCLLPADNELSLRHPKRAGGSRSSHGASRSISLPTTIVAVKSAAPPRPPAKVKSVARFTDVRR